MIKINLLPPDLKKNISAPAGLAKPDIRMALYLVPVIIGILIIAHIFLAGTAIVKNLTLISLNKQLLKQAPEKEKLDSFLKEYSVASAGASAAAGLLGARLEWAQKLNSLSRQLPAGVWLNELSFSNGVLVLRGSVIAVNKEREEVSIINRFINNLKKDQAFSGDFESLELSSVNRRSIHSFEVIDFTLTANLKNK